MKKLLVLLMLSGSVQAGLVSRADVHADAAVGMVGMNTPVQCEHHIYVTNDSDQAVTAYVYYQVCVDGHTCDQVKHEQRMEPHVNWEQSYTSQYAYQYNYAGNYQLRCSTNVVGGAYKEDVNNIRIN